MNNCRVQLFQLNCTINQKTEAGGVEGGSELWREKKGMIIIE